MRQRSLLVVLVATAACGGDRVRATTDSGSALRQTPSTSRGVDLTGAGATFPYPLLSKWFSDYAATTGVKINYQSIGSGGGIRQLSERTVDFGASDAPMSDEEIRRAKGGPVLHFPAVLGAVVVTYNLPQVAAPLKLSSEVVADIFLGKITRWDDPRIRALNAGSALPGRRILVVHRSEGSGTTFIFSDYLSTVSRAWSTGPGKGKEIAWPVGLGGRGNEGVAGAVKQTIGALGYVELAYANQNRLPSAELKNTAGEFVAPNIASISAAAEGAFRTLSPTSDFRVSIVNAEGHDAYPISSFTWLLVYAKQPDAVKGKKIVDFLRWMYSTGQGSASSLDYAPLPTSLASQLTQRLATIQIGGSAP